MNLNTSAASEQQQRCLLYGIVECRQKLILDLARCTCFHGHPWETGSFHWSTRRKNNMKYICQPRLRKHKFGGRYGRSGGACDNEGISARLI